MLLCILMHRLDCVLPLPLQSLSTRFVPLSSATPLIRSAAPLHSTPLHSTPLHSTLLVFLFVSRRALSPRSAVHCRLVDRPSVVPALRPIGSVRAGAVLPVNTKPQPHARPLPAAAAAAANSDNRRAHAAGTNRAGTATAAALAATQASSAVSASASASASSGSGRKRKEHSTTSSHSGGGDAGSSSAAHPATYAAAAAAEETPESAVAARSTSRHRSKRRKHKHKSQQSQSQSQSGSSAAAAADGAGSMSAVSATDQRSEQEAVAAAAANPQAAKKAAAAAAAAKSRSETAVESDEAEISTDDAAAASAGGEHGHGATALARRTAPILTPSGLEIDRSSLVRILAQSLQSLGYDDAAAALQRESGVDLEARSVARFRTAVLRGQWDAARAALEHLRVGSRSAKLAMRRLLCEQQYVSMLERALLQRQSAPNGASGSGGSSASAEHKSNGVTNGHIAAFSSGAGTDASASVMDALHFLQSTIVPL